MKRTPLDEMLPAEKAIFQKADDIQTNILVNQVNEREHSVYILDDLGRTILYAPYLKLLRVGPDSEDMELGLFAYFGTSDTDEENLLADHIMMIDTAYFDYNINNDDFTFRINSDGFIKAREMIKWLEEKNKELKLQKAERNQKFRLKQKAQLETKIEKLQKRLQVVNKALEEDDYDF